MIFSRSSNGIQRGKSRASSLAVVQKFSLGDTTGDYHTWRDGRLRSLALCWYSAFCSCNPHSRVVQEEDESILGMNYTNDGPPPVSVCIISALDAPISLTNIALPSLSLAVFPHSNPSMGISSLLSLDAFFLFAPPKQWIITHKFEVFRCCPWGRWWWPCDEWIGWNEWVSLCF